jgi:hypothetical protein
MFSSEQTKQIRISQLPTAETHVTSSPVASQNSDRRQKKKETFSDIYNVPCQKSLVSMETLRELGAIIEQISTNSPIHLEIALTALEGIRDQVRPERPHARAPLQQRALPVPQIWIQSEPFPEQDMPTLADPRGPMVSAISEPICFDLLNSSQLEQVRKVPFLFHLNPT